jgi:hypothetical protein
MTATTPRLLHRFDVHRQDLSRTRQIEAACPAPEAGQVRVRIGLCAYTANNITYAAFGDAMQYWSFYPTGDADWGNVPVWGFGVVEASAHPEVAVGERLYGFWPSASHVLLTPVKVRPGSFMDGAEHRQGLHAVYNQVLRCAADPIDRATQDTAGVTDPEAVQGLLRPLFTTSWLIDDLLADQAFFGAAPSDGGVPVVLSSASSKTAVAAAAHLARRPGVAVVGLTSARNRAWCERLGVYHRVLTYDQVEALSPTAPTVFVDFAGDAALRRRLHTHLAGLVHSMSVGGTHVEALGRAGDLPGPRPVLFFAPAQIKKRLADWGPEGFEQRLGAAWQAYVAQATAGPEPWLKVVRHAAPEGLEALHAQVLKGQGDPAEGHVLVWPAP